MHEVLARLGLDQALSVAGTHLHLMGAIGRPGRQRYLTKRKESAKTEAALLLWR